MLNYSVDQLIWIFVIYAFLGWCAEVIFSTIQTRKFINRGFLNGPYCPVYGFGIIIVLFLLTPIKDNLFLFFLASILLTTLLEFFTGYILERNFNRKWWDYKNEKFNIRGYVCVRSSIVWGLASVFVFYVFQPTVDNFIKFLPKNIELTLAVFLAIALIVDTVVTLISLSKVKKKVRIMEETGERIKLLSDAIGKNLSDNTINAIKISDKHSQELDYLKKKYQDVLNMRAIGYERIARAFPKLGLTKFERKSKKTK